MSNPLFDISQYQSQAPQSYNADWIDATGIDLAWDEPSLGANDKKPDDDAPSEWGSASEFTLTLPSGQTVEVKFVPSLVGERRMHQFDFAGPVSPTGFKSHFVPEVESEEFSHPRDYAQAYVEELVVQLESQPHQVKKTKLTRDHLGAEAPQGRTTDNDNSMHEPAMRENKTPDSSHVPVEVVEELSPEEEADRQRLELRVDRALYSAGCALRELRDRRLYRNTHKSWQEYCRERFGYGRDSADLRILAAEVVENLEDKVPTNRRQILPTKLEQIRPLTKLEPDEQRSVWSEAVREAGGVPSGRIVKSIVERLKERDSTPAHIPYKPGDVFLICAKSGELKKYVGCWAIATQINEYTVSIHVHDLEIIVQPEVLEPIDSLSEAAEVRTIAQRITRLRQCGSLDRGAYLVLESLGKQTYLTEVEKGLLAWLENHYGVV